MLDNALKVLNMITEEGYEAYIIGGFVRDYLLGRESNDIDVTTNAKPQELKRIFNDQLTSSNDYGSVTVNIFGLRFEITTFRKEIKYVDNRKPIEIEYINDLKIDLQRRDFTVNTICMDKDKNIIDLLGGKIDLDNKIINTVGNSYLKLKEDSLRILRAIRFSTILDFQLSEEVEEAIINNKYLLKNLSYNRKKEELDKIFASSNVDKGIRLLLKYGLDKELELNGLSNITNTESLIGIWSRLDVLDIYPFTSSEKELIENINKVMELDNLDNMVLYRYGLYVNSIAGDIKGISRKDISKKYEDLQIHSKNDLDITSYDIMNVLGKEPGKYLNEIYEDLEEKVIYNKLDNKNELLLKYIKDFYTEE